MGWHDQGDGKQFCGLYIQNGRLKGEVKKELRKIIEEYAIPVRITPHQNLILEEIEPKWRKDIQSRLEKCGLVDASEMD